MTAKTAKTAVIDKTAMNRANRTNRKKMFFKWAKPFCAALLAIMVTLSGCGAKESTVVNTDDSRESLKIATSFYPIYLFTLNITKGISNVTVVNMTKPTTGCLHDYALTTEDLKSLEDAKVLVINGAGMESFLAKVTGQMPDLKIIDASEGITLIQDETGKNPHVWLSISKAIRQVQNIGDKLTALDPENAEKYQENAAEYIAKLEQEKNKMHQALDGVKNRDIVTFHEAFPYFAEEFHLNVAAVIEREPGSEPSPIELTETIEKIKALKVKALFAEPQYSADTAETIANETGARVYYLDPIVTGPLEADAYIDLMDKNLQTLQGALQ
ncbi:metal ABC transporter substrate-binding protein [Dehalobacter restrictus]|uniref:metal ABC transporter substrate-binding protein n=1 Tax=Dehalobacter restrictus TaxID=55583 RepID=UPI00338D7011